MAAIAAGARITLASLSADDVAARLDELGTLLHACVHAGASIGFVLPFDGAAARAFWTARVVPGLQGGGLVLLAALREGAVVGSVQLDCDTPANQPHRAEVRKLLVHPDFRRQGIARALMCGLERVAASRRRSLLTLDTRTGDDAEPLYASLGYAAAGVVPGYCLAPAGDRLDATTIMFKRL